MKVLRILGAVHNTRLSAMHLQVGGAVGAAAVVPIELTHLETSVPVGLVESDTQADLSWFVDIQRKSEAMGWELTYNMHQLQEIANLSITGSQKRMVGNQHQQYGAQDTF